VCRKHSHVQPSTLFRDRVLVLTLLDEHAIEGCDAEYDWLILAVMGGMQEQAFKIVYSDTF